MMNYVKATLYGKTYYLLKQADETWKYTNRPPNINDEVPVDIQVKIEDGKVVSISTNDEELVKSITVFVQDKLTQSGRKMFKYYPECIAVLLEFKALMLADGFDIDFITCELELIWNDFYLFKMGKERIQQWEIALGITPSSKSSLDDRRSVIVARFRSGYKLNTNTISVIVNSFTNGTTESYFLDSCVYVEISPPPDNKQYQFEDVEREIARRIPCHLNYSVKRNYSTWGELADSFASWDSIKQGFTTWDEIAIYTIRK